jgi:hypothetical protein
MKTSSSLFNHRSALLAIGATVASAGSLNRLMAAEHTGHGAKTGPADECARACADCLIECARHIHHCTQHLADGHRDYAKCLELCSACASSCSAFVMACFGPAAQRRLRPAAKMCDLCAAECEKFKDDATMQACAKSCRDCAKACRVLAKA